MRALSAQGREAFERLLAPREVLLFASKQHWLTLWRPTAISVGALVLLTASAIKLDTSKGYGGAKLLFLLFLVVVFSWLFAYAKWRRQWFGVTSKRLLFLEGLIDTDVQMMPLAKLTDMTYRETWLGDWLGYGHFIVESAGQQQALNRLKFIPDALTAREEITKALFGFAPAPVRLPDDSARRWFDDPTLAAAAADGDEDDDGGEWIEEPPEGMPPGDGSALSLPAAVAARWAGRWRSSESAPGDGPGPTSAGGRHGHGPRPRPRESDPSHGPVPTERERGPERGGDRSARRSPRGWRSRDKEPSTIYRSPDLRREDDTDELPAIPVRLARADELFPPPEWFDGPPR